MLTLDNCKKVNIELPEECGFSLDYSVSDLAEESLNSDKYVVLPGLCDVHVHFREPGFVYKENIFSGSRAGAKGGYTSVMTMPNTASTATPVQL